MSFPSKIIYLNIFSLLIFGIFNSCKSAQKVQNLSDFEPERQSIEENYKPYNYMEASITLNGYIDNKYFSYPGKIKVIKDSKTNDLKLSLTITDPIFLSPFFKLSLDSGNLYYKNFIENIEENIEYSDSEISFMSSHVMPSTVLLPLFIGMLPDKFIKHGKKIGKTDEYLYKSDRFIISGTFNENSLSTLILKNREDQEPIKFQFEGKKKNDFKRYFPEKIRIFFPKNENLQIIYNNLKIN